MPENKQLLESLFSEQAGFPVRISVPNKGKKKDIVDLILKNIKLIHSKGGDPGLVELKDLLHLPVIPNVIECFDISNHGDAFAVGSMSRFVGGIPDKSGYRKFKIRTVSGRDDFAMIGEIIKRRYYRLLEENSDLPDLIVIDGGKGQLSAAVKVADLSWFEIALHFFGQRKRGGICSKKQKSNHNSKIQTVVENPAICTR